MANSKKAPSPLLRWSDLLRVFGTAAVMFTTLTVVYFPWSTDDWTAEQEEIIDFEVADDYYEEVYAGEESAPVDDAAESNDHDYVLNGQITAEKVGVTDLVTQFIEDNGLEAARALEVGAGSGQLQDVVSDYTGLDIAASAERYFHKPFVHGSATSLPFDDSSFDVVWSVWTLEHVPNPERALDEMRRVVKDGGYVFLWPAWLCGPDLAEGYPVRPFSDFSLSGKISKAALGIRQNPVLVAWGTLATRVVRNAYWRMSSEPTRLRFSKLNANYDEYWLPDADAAVSLDVHETMLWFASRGDECPSCSPEFGEQVQMRSEPLIIRIQKPERHELAQR